MKQNRFIQRNKKKLLRKDTVRVSEAEEVLYKRNVVKHLLPVYLHIIEIDIR